MRRRLVSRLAKKDDWVSRMNLFVSRCGNITATLIIIGIVIVAGLMIRNAIVKGSSAQSDKNPYATYATPLVYTSPSGNPGSWITMKVSVFNTRGTRLINITPEISCVDNTIIDSFTASPSQTIAPNYNKLFNVSIKVGERVVQGKYSCTVFIDKDGFNESEEFFLRVI